MRKIKGTVHLEFPGDRTRTERTQRIEVEVPDDASPEAVQTAVEDAARDTFHEHCNYGYEVTSYGVADGQEGS